MPTILEQAETIRDETVEYANTPARVGACLVDIANALNPPYCFGYGSSNTTPTIITNGGTYYKAVFTLGLSDGSGFTVDEFGVITCTYEDAAGYYGLYNVNVVMSVAGESGSHVVCAAIGSDTLVDENCSVGATLANGVGKPHQIVMNFPYGIQSGEKIAVWLTDEHSGDELIVSDISITITRLATLAI